MDFNNGFPRDGIIFGVGNSSSFHDNNLKAIFFCQLKERLMILMAVLLQQRKILILTLVKQRKKLAWVCILMVIILISLLKRKKSISFWPIIKISTLQLIPSRKHIWKTCCYWIWRSIFKRKCVRFFSWLQCYWWILLQKNSQVFNGWEYIK